MALTVSSTLVQQRKENLQTFPSESDEAKLLHAGLDFITIRTLQRLFPSSRTAWKPFLIGLLHNATIKLPTAWTHILSFPEEEHDDDAAVGYFTGINDLSQKLHLAYETTHLHYTFFKAIGLLFTTEQTVQRHKRLILVLPLASYHIPEGLSEQLEQFKMRYGRRQAHLLVEQISEHLIHCSTPGDTSLPKTHDDERVLEEVPQASPVPHFCASLQTILSSVGVESDEQIVERMTEEMLSFARRAAEDWHLKETSHVAKNFQVGQTGTTTGDTVYTESRSESSGASTQDSSLSTKPTEKVSTSSSRLPLDPQDSLHRDGQPLSTSDTNTRVETETPSATNLLANLAPVDSHSVVSINGLQVSARQVMLDVVGQ